MEKLFRFAMKNSRWAGAGVALLFFALSGMFDIPAVLRWVPTALVLAILNRHLVGQYWAMVYLRLKHGSRLPSKENYVCEGDYILPFAGKWSVYDGGVTKELSIAWGEMSQRYAYCFLIFDDDGNVNDGRDSSVESYHCYGKDVLAAAAGVVVKASGKHADSRTDGMKVYCDTWDVRGNHVVIRHNDNEFSYVGHLMPGSVAVKVGDRVKQGDVIAKCGNSGYTAEPHLHFQLQSSKSFTMSAGLPIAFANVKARDSIGYEAWHEKAGAARPSTKGNLEMAGGKTYIGRGLDVENE